MQADDWPQWLGPQRDSVWREQGIVARLPREGLRIVWRAPVAQGYAGPAVAAGKVFVTDWVRSPKAKPPGNPFDTSTVLEGRERVHCLDAKTGKSIWVHEYDCAYKVSYAAGPRCTPTVSQGRVYTLGTMGDLFCLDAETGRPIWQRNFPKEFGAKVPIWGYASHPLLDGERLICLVGGDRDSLVVAFDSATGKEVWRSLATTDDGHGCGYAPPVIAEVGKNRQLIVWHPEGISSLDPATGKEYWTVAFKLRSGLSVPTPRVSGDRLFVTAFYNGPMMLQLAQDQPAARVLWRAKENVNERRTEGLHSIMSTPMLKDGYIFGVCSYGQLRCLRMDSGERLWGSLLATSPRGKPKEERWGNAFLVAHEDRFFLFNEHGELILARLSPDGYEELDRVPLLEPTNGLVNRPVVWSHPAFAMKCVFARNDREIVCASLAADE
ncbi:MAG: PQQ-like beta-propeller repeat protein [Gemmataceae bacterium]|nr:PQQ-like beta-propeller repeat protein [Gemmataceae bacterium]